MSYISATKSKDTVIIWERIDGERTFKIEKAPYYFYEKGDGPYKSMYGDTLIKKKFTNSLEFHQAKKANKQQGVVMFESDIPPELKLLSKEYYGVPAPELNISFLDIEVDFCPRKYDENHVVKIRKKS